MSDGTFSDVAVQINTMPQKFLIPFACCKIEFLYRVPCALGDKCRRQMGVNFLLFQEMQSAVSFRPSALELNKIAISFQWLTCLLHLSSVTMDQFVSALCTFILLESCCCCCYYTPTSPALPPLASQNVNFDNPPSHATHPIPSKT